MKRLSSWVIALALASGSTMVAISAPPETGSQGEEISQASSPGTHANIGPAGTAAEGSTRPPRSTSLDSGLPTPSAEGSGNTSRAGEEVRIDGRADTPSAVDAPPSASPIDPAQSAAPPAQPPLDDAHYYLFFTSNVLGEIDPCG